MMFQVNLMPWRQQQRHVRCCQRLLFLFMAIIFFTVGLLYLGCINKKQNQQANNRLLLVQQESRQLASQIELIQEKQQRLAQLNKILVDINSLTSSTRQLLVLLSYMPQIIPEQVWLTEISVNKHRLTLRGCGYHYSAIVDFSLQIKVLSFVQNGVLAKVNSEISPINDNKPTYYFIFDADWQE